MANTSTGSLQSKKSPDVLSINANLKRRVNLFRQKYATVTGVKKLILKVFMYALIIGLAFIFLYPFLYMISNSLMSNADLSSSSVKWLPTQIKFENFAVAWDLMNPTRYAWNSFLVTAIASLGHVLSCSFIAYGFARFNFPGKKFLFACVILAFIVPIQTLIIPLYLTYSRMQWLNTYLPLLVPTFFGFGLKGALYVFIFRQFFLTLPKDLESAAKIDGCGFLMTFWRIVFPLAQSTLVVVLVLSVVWHWNDFYEPGLYINRPALGFLPPKLNSIIAAASATPDEQQELLRNLGLADGEDVLNNAVVMAGALMISAPVLIFFGFAQRKFMQGIERSGITGE